MYNSFQHNGPSCETLTPSNPNTPAVHPRTAFGINGFFQANNSPPNYTPTVDGHTPGKLIPESVVRTILQKYNIPNNALLITEMLESQATAYAKALSTTIWFGKYKDQNLTFADVAERDPMYLKKMVTMRDENGQNWLANKAPDQYNEILNLLYMKD